LNWKVSGLVVGGLLGSMRCGGDSEARVLGMKSLLTGAERFLKKKPSLQFANPSTQRTAARITALHSAAGFGMGCAQLVSGGAQGIGGKDKLVVLAVGNGFGAAFLAWRSWTKNRKVL
jgi:hypothetical protein